MTTFNQVAEELKTRGVMRSDIKQVLPLTLWQVVNDNAHRGTGIKLLSARRSGSVMQALILSLETVNAGDDARVKLTVTVQDLKTKQVAWLEMRQNNKVPTVSRRGKGIKVRGLISQTVTLAELTAKELADIVLLALRQAQLAPIGDDCKDSPAHSFTTLNWIHDVRFGNRGKAIGQTESLAKL